MAWIDLELFSHALSTFVGVTVLMPQGGAPEHGFPVLWLLHGMSDDDTMWLRRTSVERYADARRLAVVMPGAELSCYTDMAHGGRFYTYIARELPEALGDMFPLSARREDNFIAGLSMGGEGAFKLGLSNPGRYSVIGCLSAGAFNHPWVDDPDPETMRWRYMRYAGKKLDGSPEDCFNNAKRILASGGPVPRIYHAIGRSDPLLAAARETRDFFQHLDGDPFGYVYEEDPGAHTWDFWDTHIRRFLEFAFDGK